VERQNNILLKNMSLHDQLNVDFKTVFKAKEELKTSVLRMLLSAIKNKEFEKRNKLSKTEKDAVKLEKNSQLNDEEVMAVIASEAKKRKDSIDQYEKGGRAELAKKEKEELVILQVYLPEQMNEDKIRQLVKEAITKAGAAGAQDTGKVMKELMPQVKGKADGGSVSRIVKEELEK